MWQGKIIEYCKHYFEVSSLFVETSTQEEKFAEIKPDAHLKLFLSP